MKVGSLVEFIGGKIKKGCEHRIKWMPIKGEIYTVRAISRLKEEGVKVLVEEGVVGYNGLGIETGCSINCFRELQPPMDLSELLEETVLQEL